MKSKNLRTHINIWKCNIGSKLSKLHKINPKEPLRQILVPPVSFLLSFTFYLLIVYHSFEVFGLSKEKTLQEKERLAALRLQEKKEREARAKAGIVHIIENWHFLIFFQSKPLQKLDANAVDQSTFDFNSPDKWKGQAMSRVIIIV